MFTIYEAGESILHELRAEACAKTYACVAESAQEKTMPEALDLLKEQLLDDGFKPLLYNDTSFITEASEIFGVAHEIVYESEAFVRKPSNILRHVFSSPLTIYSLYKDEQGEIIDLTQKGLKHINSMSLLSCMNNFKEYLTKNPDEILPILKLRCGVWCPINPLNNFLMDFESRLPFKSKQQLLNLLTENQNHIKYLEYYPGLYRYFVEQGLKFLPMFGDPLPVQDLPPHPELGHIKLHLNEQEEDE